MSKIDTTSADDSSSTDITWYFSEGGQVFLTKRGIVNSSSDVIISADHTGSSKGNNFTIVGFKVFFSSSGLLIDGDLYAIGAPAGLLVDLVGNRTAVTISVGTFTVLSGSTSSAADAYYEGSFAAAVAGSTNATTDITASTCVFMYSPVGAIDVSISNITVTMLFSESVKFNASGFISIVNSSGKVITSINLTKDVDVISTAYNGIRLDLTKVTGCILAKGGAFIVAVSAGVLVNFAGNAAVAISGIFITLAGTADITDSTVVMTSPTHEASGILGSSKFQLYSRDTTDALAFEIEGEAVGSTRPTRIDAALGNKVMAGNKISITPKSLCTGSLSCAKLTNGTTYYSKTDRDGVLEDTIENSLAAINARSSWY